MVLGDHGRAHTPFCGLLEKVLSPKTRGGEGPKARAPRASACERALSAAEDLAGTGREAPLPKIDELVHELECNPLHRSDAIHCTSQGIAGAIRCTSQFLLMRMKKSFVEAASRQRSPINNFG